MKISIVIPVYNMPNKDFFLKRCLSSIQQQTFKDYEIVMPDTGGMAANFNAGIKQAKGEFIKFLCMDDYFSDRHSLEILADVFRANWLVTGCLHDDGQNIGSPHLASYNEEIHLKNTIGSPSVLMIKNKDPLLFDETMSWLVDCDYYKRLYDKYGSPEILNQANVVIGLHPGQATNILSDELKLSEQVYMQKKYLTNDERRDL